MTLRTLISDLSTLSRSVTRAAMRPGGVRKKGARIARIVRNHRFTRPGLAPQKALIDNGFCVFRQVVAPREIAEWRRELGGIHEDKRHQIECDASNKLPVVGDKLFHRGILTSVREALGPEIRFLQTSGFQWRNDFVSWHRDSACRVVGQADWDESIEPYRVVKAIAYVEGQDTTLAVLHRTHQRDVDMDEIRRMDQQGIATVIGPNETGNREFSEEESARPIVVCLRPGDLMVFDQRLFHRGGRYDNNREGVIVDKRKAQRGKPKLTLSWVFGAPNTHSRRHYSYFRFARRDLSYAPLRDDLRERLKAAGLFMPEENYFLESPEDLKEVWLAKPETRDEMLAEWGSARRP